MEGQISPKKLLSLWLTNNLTSLSLPRTGTLKITDHFIQTTPTWKEQLYFRKLPSLKLERDRFSDLITVSKIALELNFTRTFNLILATTSEFSRAKTRSETATVDLVV